MNEQLVRNIIKVMDDRVKRGMDEIQRISAIAKADAAKLQGVSHEEVVSKVGALAVELMGHGTVILESLSHRSLLMFLLGEREMPAIELPGQTISPQDRHDCFTAALQFELAAQAAPQN